MSRHALRTEIWHALVYHEWSPWQLAEQMRMKHGRGAVIALEFLMTLDDSTITLELAEGLSRALGQRPEYYRALDASGEASSARPHPGRD